MSNPRIRDHDRSSSAARRPESVPLQSPVAAGDLAWSNAVCGRNRSGPREMMQQKAMSIYDTIGVRTIINAKGASTRARRARIFLLRR